MDNVGGGYEGATVVWREKCWLLVVVVYKIGRVVVGLYR